MRPGKLLRLGVDAPQHDTSLTVEILDRGLDRAFQYLDVNIRMLA